MNIVCVLVVFNSDNLARCQACETMRYPNLPTEADITAKTKHDIATDKASGDKRQQTSPPRPPKP